MTDTSVPSDPQSPAPDEPSAPLVALPDDLLDPYLAQQLPEASASRVRRYIDQRPEWQRVVRALRSWLAESDIPVPPGARDASTRLMARLTPSTAAQVGTGRSDGRSVPLGRRDRSGAREGAHNGAHALFARLVYHRGLFIGAAMVVLVAVGSVLVRRGVQDSAAGTETVYATASGQRATVVLRDGSRVVLAPRSRLTVGRAFGATSRAVTLSGEAYFSVASASGTPFIVHTGAVSTRVLGTAFDVRRYPSDRTTRVVVVTGKVMVGGRRTPVLLTAGKIGEVTDTTAIASATSDTHAYTDWTSGRLVFDDVPAAAMLATVGRWYGYEFRYADSTLATQHVTAVFNISAHDETLAAIKTLLGVTMTFDDSTVTLHRQPVHSHRASPSSRRDAILTPTSEVGR